MKSQELHWKKKYPWGWEEYHGTEFHEWSIYDLLQNAPYSQLEGR